MINSKYKVAFITPIPNYHRPELFQRMFLHPKIDLLVYFCSKEDLNGELLSKIFNIKDNKWEIDFFKGYNYKFLRNYSPFRSEFMKTKLLSHLNFGIWNEIKKGEYHAVVITMWNDVTYWLAAIASRYFNKPLFFAGDSTILTDELRPKWIRHVKKLILGKILFRMASGFLYTGRLNRQFFQQYGASEDRLFFYPLSVDYDLNVKKSQNLNLKRAELRVENNIQNDAYVIIFVGRLSDEKRPIDVVKAFKEVKSEKKILLMVGDGKLRTKIQQIIQNERIKGVYLQGFKNREEIYKYYAISDVLVLPSSADTHGAVINEGMCFGLPIIVSDKVGASVDLVKHNVNGYVYPCCDTKMLASYIDQLSDKKTRKKFGKKSQHIVKEWDHSKAIDGLIQALDSIYC